MQIRHSKHEYLSHIIENGTIRPNPEKTAVVSNAKRPKTVRQIQAFLGLVSYYRKFIKGCSSIASPLIKLTEKNTNFNWTHDCEHAFQTLKKFLISDTRFGSTRFRQRIRCRSSVLEAFYH